MATIGLGGCQKPPLSSAKCGPEPLIWINRVSIEIRASGRERRSATVAGERHSACASLRAGAVAKGRFTAASSAREATQKLLQRRLMGFPLDLALRYMG